MNVQRNGRNGAYFLFDSWYQKISDVATHMHRMIRIDALRSFTETNFTAGLPVPTGEFQGPAS